MNLNLKTRGGVVNARRLILLACFGFYGILGIIIYFLFL